MNKKVIEALVEEDIGTARTLYPLDAKTEKSIAEFVKQQTEVGNPCRYELVTIQGAVYIALIQPDPTYTPEELTILAQLNCSKTTKKLIKHVKIIKGILIFFCVLICISLTAGLIYIGQLLSELSSLSSTSIW